VDVVLNLLLFLPFGAGLGLAGWSWRRAAVAAALLSFTVETLQYFVVTGRDPSLGDLINNTAGGAAGAAVAGRLGGLAWPSASAARRLLLCGTVIWLAWLGVSALSLSPGAGPGQIHSVWGQFEPEPFDFEGEVTSATLAGDSLPRDGTPENAAAVRARLLGGDLRLEVYFLTGPPTADGSWIYGLRVSQRPHLTLVQHQQSVLITVPTHGVRWRLQAPTVSLPDALPNQSGAPVTVEGGRRNNTIWLTSTYAGQGRSVEVELSPAHGWQLVAPFNYPMGPDFRLITGLCLALLVFPLGYWASRTGRPLVAAGFLSLVLAIGLGLLPALAGFAPVHWSEWLSAGLAAALGWALRRPAAYLQGRCGSPSINESSSS
jgi:VanZ like family